MSFSGKKFGSNKRSGSQDSDLSLTPEEWDEKARGILLARLTHGPRTKLQLFQLLAGKGVPQEVATSLLDRFEEVGLIDDAAYALAFTHDRRQTRGLAKSALKRELRQAGVAIEQIDDAVDAISSEDDFELALVLVRKRWPSLAKLESEARYRRVAGYLGRRGFSGSTISSAIRAVSAETAQD